MNCPPLILGCASMLGFVDRQTSVRAVHDALELGIYGFDIARSYGYGQAESLLGQCLKGRRSEVFVISKHGIPPAAGWRANLIRCYRGGWGGLRHWQWHRSFGLESLAHPIWSAAAIEAGVQRSLRELRFQELDALLLHAPPADLLQREEVRSTLERLRTRGLLRSWGFSAGPEHLPAFEPQVQHAQFRFNLLHAQRPAAPQAGGLRSINHVFGGRGGRASLVQALQRAAQHFDPALAEALTQDPQLATETLLRTSLHAAGAQSLVVAMHSRSHQLSNLHALRQGRLTEVQVQTLSATLLPSDPQG